MGSSFISIKWIAVSNRAKKTYYAEAIVAQLLVLAVTSPLEEVHILGVLDESGSHHDGLEALTVDRPQFHMDKC